MTTSLIKSKHETSYNGFLSKNLNGVCWQAEKRLTEKKLSKIFESSPPTIVKVMREMQKKKLVVRRQEDGLFVSDSMGINNQILGLTGHLQFISGKKEIINGTNWGMMILQLVHFASQSDYSLLLNDVSVDVSDPVDRIKIICQHLIESQITGVFYSPLESIKDANTINKEITTSFDDNGIYVILLNRDIHDSHRSKYDIVAINHKQSSFELTHHLLEVGCRKINFIVDPLCATAFHEKINGYRNALEKYNIIYEQKRVQLVNWSILVSKESKMIVQEMISSLKEKEVDAFICENDSIASDLIYYFLNNEIRIPEDIRIVSFGDYPTNKFLPVPLTTVRHSNEALAYEMVRTMMNRIENPTIQARNILLQAEFIHRKSCGGNL